MRVKFTFLFFLFFNMFAFSKSYTDYPMLDRYKGENPNENQYVESSSLKKYLMSFDKEGRVTVGGENPLGNTLIFVMDSKGDFYASYEQIHHSSFLRGESVACAGHMLLENGVVHTVMNSSGHYAPPAISLISVAEEFLERGVDISTMKFTPVQVRDLQSIEAQVKYMIHLKGKQKKCRSVLDQILG